MFCLDPLTPLFNATVEIVADVPGITVEALRDRLKKHAKIDVSLQHVYRTVTRLVEAQMLLKRKKQLFLNLLWLSHIELFAQSAKHTMLGKPDLRLLGGLSPGKRVQFSAKSLQEMQALWHHLLIQCNREVPEGQERLLYKYYSHAWWLLHNPGDAAFYERIAERGVRCFWLLGSESYLDRLSQQRYKKLFAIAVTDHSPFPTEGYNLNVFGDYVLECVFPKAIRDHLALLFRSIRSDKDWNSAVLDGIFHIRAPFTVTVTRDPRKADQLRGKIERLMPRATSLRRPS